MCTSGQSLDLFASFARLLSEGPFVESLGNHHVRVGYFGDRLLGYGQVAHEHVDLLERCVRVKHPNESQGLQALVVSDRHVVGAIASCHEDWTITEEPLIAVLHLGTGIKELHHLSATLTVRPDQVHFPRAMFPPLVFPPIGLDFFVTTVATNHGINFRYVVTEHGGLSPVIGDFKRRVDLATESNDGNTEPHGVSIGSVAPEDWEREYPQLFFDTLAQVHSLLVLTQTLDAIVIVTEVGDYSHDTSFARAVEPLYYKYTLRLAEVKSNLGIIPLDSA